MTDPYRSENPSDGITPPYRPEGYPPPPPAGGYPPPPGSYVPPQDPYAPPPEQFPYGAPYPPPPGAYYDPMAPYGRHPVTGEPYSDKSKVVAGLLQLIGLFGFLGFGRIYIGQTGFGVAQLVGGLLITAVTFGFGFVVPFVWGIVDAILMFSGSTRDPQGRPLRDGT